MGINYILKYITIILDSKNISRFCCILGQINAGLVSRRDLFKNIKSVTLQSLLTGSVNLLEFYHLAGESLKK